MKTFFLTQTQASAIIRAAAALQQCNAQMSQVRIGDYHVIEHGAGHIVIKDVHDGYSEIHNSFNAMALHYGINTSM